jgi:hypothetical protein
MTMLARQSKLTITRERPRRRFAMLAIIPQPYLRLGLRDN